MTEPDKYYEESNINIQEWKNTLAQNKSLSAIDKQRLRNKISALKSRMSKKSELSGLQDQIKQAKKQFENLVCVLFDQMDSTQRANLIDRFNNSISESEGDKDFEVERPGGKKRQKTSSNKQWFAFNLNKYVGLEK